MFGLEAGYVRQSIGLEILPLGEGFTLNLSYFRLGIDFLNTQELFITKINTSHRIVIKLIQKDIFLGQGVPQIGAILFEHGVPDRFSEFGPEQFLRQLDDALHEVEGATH